ncbi:MAG: 50S ribosome-binding GTPase, partial [Sphaerochaetaceae bacterium]|nr:50S ribosome-binding GTPase [Sphaerochaetaceae bacterium]
LFNKILEIKNIVLDIMATVEVQLDYSEDEIGEDLEFPFNKLQLAIDTLKSIATSYETGRLYSQGAKVVLCGPSNAGKSSLFNYFLKEDRSIVSAIPGTTRDFIEAACNVRGIPIRLFDTAGFRGDWDNEIEEEGIKRSVALMEDADLILYLIDGNNPPKVIDKDLIKDSRTIAIVNKSDLCSKEYEGFINLSVVTGEGFYELCTLMEGLLTKDEPYKNDSLIIESSRQRVCLKRASESLIRAYEIAYDNLPLDIVTMDLNEGLEALSEITGETTTDDILDSIFGTFCVGK